MDALQKAVGIMERDEEEKYASILSSQDMLVAFAKAQAFAAIAQAEQTKRLADLYASQVEVLLRLERLQEREQKADDANRLLNEIFRRWTSAPERKPKEERSPDPLDFATEEEFVAAMQEWTKSKHAGQ